MRSPTVAIVGRPNVGKSTLFNRLVGRRQSIVHDLPGVTRDRVTALVELDGRSLHLVDTGGLVSGGETTLGIDRQVLAAVEEADVLIHVVDGREGPTAGDQEVVERLRRYGRPTILAVNKGDTTAGREALAEFSRLGVEPRVLVSAEHGLGIGELVEALLERLPAAMPAPAVDAPRLAIVGRPNVGKSSLLNRLTGGERALVSETPGTTRDPVDSLVERDGRLYLWVDTAGIRRRSRAADTAEELAIMMARRQIEAAELAVLVVDAVDGVTGGDLAIAGSVWEQGRAAVVAVNKWDLLGEDSRRRLEEGWERLDSLLARPRRVNVSAATGRAVEKLYPAIDETLGRWRLEVPTGELNRIFHALAERRRPPSRRGERRPWKLYYVTQVSTGPPTFMLFANRTLPRSSPYRRYLENGLRRELDLAGVPVRLVVRRRG